MYCNPSFGARQGWRRVVSLATGPPIGRLLSELLDPRPGMTVYDPGFGTGRLLRALEQHARVRRGDARSGACLGIFGQERDPLAFSVGAALFARAGIGATLALGDTLRSPAFRLPDGALRRFDRIVANPTREQAVCSTVYTADRHERFGFGRPLQRCADWDWVQHGVASLDVEGRMAIVLGAAALSRPADRHIRQAIVEADLLETVVWSDRVSVLVFDRAKRHPGQMLMVGAPWLSSVLGARLGEGFRSAARIVHSRRSRPGVAAVVDAEQIALRRFDLRPTFYLGAA